MRTIIPVILFFYLGGERYPRAEWS